MLQDYGRSRSRSTRSAAKNVVDGYSRLGEQTASSSTSMSEHGRCASELSLGGGAGSDVMTCAETERAVDAVKFIAGHLIDDDSHEEVGGQC